MDRVVPYISHSKGAHRRSKVFVLFCFVLDFLYLFLFVCLLAAREVPAVVSMHQLLQVSVSVLDNLCLHRVCR